jgi:hypothetical protein
MDVVICSALTKSCLLHASSSSDFPLRHAENLKCNKDMRNNEPLQHSATQRFIPLAMNQCGRRDSHFDDALREHAARLIKRPSGYRLLHGPFAVPPNVALAKVLETWGSRLTRAAQRECAAQIVRAIQIHTLALQGARMATEAFMAGLLAINISGWDSAGGQSGQGHVG